MSCSTPLSTWRYPPHRLGLLGPAVVSAILVLGPRSSQAASHAPREADATPPSLDRMLYYQDGAIAEYCHDESYNLGTCLGRQRLELIDYSQEMLVRCIECSGGTTLGGHETCDEIKALNDVGGGGGSGPLGGDGGATMIDWDESFCESYDRCVAENCPDRCRREQDAFLECLVVELDCDWRCMPGSTWSIGETGGMGGGGGGATMMESAAPGGADVSAFSAFGSRTRMAAGLLLLAGALM